MFGSGVSSSMAAVGATPETFFRFDYEQKLDYEYDFLESFRFDYEYEFDYEYDFLLTAIRV